MKRIIAHWTAGTYTPNGIDKRHYHYIVDGDGIVHSGTFPISANEKPEKGKYAAHTLNCNTGSIGIAMACMAGAIEGKEFGKYPMKRVQFDAMCMEIARLCKLYKIPVTPKTVLSHAEVEKNLGVKQRGKWDFTVLPFLSGAKGATECGEYMRMQVRDYLAAMNRPINPAPVTPEPKPTAPKVEVPASTPEPVSWWVRLFKALFRRN